MVLETCDGVRAGEVGKSDEMETVKRRSSREHAISVHLNLIGVLAAGGYGVLLETKLRLVEDCVTVNSL